MPDLYVFLILTVQLITLGMVTLMVATAYIPRRRLLYTLIPRRTIIQRAIPQLPDNHNWSDKPVLIRNSDGAFDRWTCEDCGQYIDHRRGDPWQT